MSAPPPVGTVIDVRLSYGPLLVGAFFNMILFGVLIGQVCGALPEMTTYGYAFLVWGVFSVEVVNTALDMTMLYQPLILDYGAIPDKLPWVFVTQPLCVILVGFPIQLFFIWRIYSLTHNTVVTMGILSFSLVSFGGGAWTTVMVPIVKTFGNLPRLYRSAELWLISAATTDLCIAVTLAVALRNKKTGFTHTDTVVDKIIRLTVQTGMLTALFSVLDVICFVSFKGKTVNFLWNIPLTKLYANCLMSTLNARERLNRSMNPQHSSGQNNFVLSVGGDKVHQDGDTFAANDDFQGTEPQFGIRMTKVVERM
ncbi:hypothetical protein MSAN_01908900 [Mycena sanguinolenta]|uniref:DUF6534 domain-containing protein n=1 Tax=Mycena sanguinolenta TaxID=230812 RepID=A0A8H6XS42_9AGAR|nr:hypothetical protein MSAN_01908900 [Mycena sanguinolenta]